MKLQCRQNKSPFSSSEKDFVCFMQAEALNASSDKAELRFESSLVNVTCRIKKLGIKDGDLSKV